MRELGLLAWLFLGIAIGTATNLGLTGFLLFDGIAGILIILDDIQTRREWKRKMMR